MEKAVL